MGLGEILPESVFCSPAGRLACPGSLDRTPILGTYATLTDAPASFVSLEGGRPGQLL